MTPLINCVIPNEAPKTKSTWFNTVMDNDPTTAAPILLLAPPETDIPPKTIAINTSIPIEPPVDLLKVGALKIVMKAANPTPSPEKQNE